MSGPAFATMGISANGAKFYSTLKTYAFIMAYCVCMGVARIALTLTIAPVNVTRDGPARRAIKKSMNVTPTRARMVLRAWTSWRIFTAIALKYLDSMVASFARLRSHVHNCRVAMTSRIFAQTSRRLRCRVFNVCAASHGSATAVKNIRSSVPTTRVLTEANVCRVLQPFANVLRDGPATGVKTHRPFATKNPAVLLAHACSTATHTGAIVSPGGKAPTATSTSMTAFPNPVKIEQLALTK